MVSPFSDNRTALAHLRRRWVLFAGLCLTLLCAGYAFLRVEWPASDALRWLLLASAVSAYLLHVLWRHLPHNRRAGENELLPSFGAGNHLTLLRGVLIACLAGFLFAPRPSGWLAWLPGILYTSAGLMDYLDGWLARATNHATRLGEALDISLDSLGVLIAALLAVQYGQVPAAYLAVALARYIYTGSLWVWRRLGGSVYPLPPSIRRRAFAGLQMGFLFVILWPVFSPPGTHIAAALFALPFLAGFIYDWLAAAGRIQSKGRRSTLQELAVRWLPVLLRLAAMVLLALPFALRFLDLPTPAIPDPFTASSGPPVLYLLEAAVLILLLLGIAGRAVSIAALVLLGVHQIFAPLSPAQIALALVYTALLYLGTGALSLWRPEDRLIYRRMGERPQQEGRPHPEGRPPERTPAFRAETRSSPAEALHPAQRGRISQEEV